MSDSNINFTRGINLKGWDFLSECTDGMKQRLISFENVTTTPRTFVYYAETLEDLYSFMECEFLWFNREKHDIRVSWTRYGSLSRKFIQGDVIPDVYEDLYIKVVPRENKPCVEISEKIYPTCVLECGRTVH